MEKINVTDEWLYKYMPIVDEAIIRELESSTDYEYQFSDKFEKQMKKLIERERHPWLEVFYRILKKAAVLFVCMISSLVIVSMSVEAYRVKIFDTIKTIWEDSVLYSYFTNQNQKAFQCHEPGYILEGYQETERILLEYWFSVIYTNEEGDMITWDQMLVQDEGKIVTDIEYDQQITKEINGMNVVISIYSNGFVSAYCEQDEYVYILTADEMSVDEVCLIFDSIANE